MADREDRVAAYLAAEDRVAAYLAVVDRMVVNPGMAADKVVDRVPAGIVDFADTVDSVGIVNTRLDIRSR